MEGETDSKLSPKTRKQTLIQEAVELDVREQDEEGIDGTIESERREH